MQEQIYNVFDKKAEAVENNLKKARQVEAAKKVYKDRPFSERYDTAATASVILGFIGNAASFITGSTAIGYSLYISLNNMSETVAIGAGSVIGIGAAALLEIMKTTVIIAVFTAIYKYRKVSIGMVITAIALQAISIGISFYGGRMLPQIATSAPPQFDGSEYDKRAAEIAAEIETIRKMNKWEGTVTSVGNEFIKAEKAKEKQVEAARAEALADHKAKTAAAEAKQGETTNFVGYIAIGNEAIILFCFAFYSYFLYRVYRENEESEGDGADSPTRATTTTPPPPAEPTTTKTSTGGEAAPTNNSTRPIGFFKTASPDEIIIVKAEPPADNKNPHLKECEHCQKQYQYNAKKQKFCSNECRWAADKARKAAKC